MKNFEVKVVEDISQLTFDKHESDSRIDVKDILSANKISNQEELASALKRLDQIWDAEHLSEVGSELYQLVDLIQGYEGKSWDSYSNSVNGI